jgi:hypothetical protein
LSRYHHGTVRVAFGAPQQLAGEEAGVEAALQDALRRELARLIEAA